MRTLKLVFHLDNNKTTICSLAEPKESLTAAEVQAVAEDIIGKRALIVNGAFPTSVKTMYVQDSEQVPLA